MHFACCCEDEDDDDDDEGEGNVTVGGSGVGTCLCPLVRGVRRGGESWEPVFRNGVPDNGRLLAVTSLRLSVNEVFFKFDL